MMKTLEMWVLKKIKKNWLPLLIIVVIPFSKVFLFSDMPQTVPQNWTFSAESYRAHIDFCKFMLLMVGGIAIGSLIMMDLEKLNTGLVVIFVMSLLASIYPILFLSRVLF